MFLSSSDLDENKSNLNNSNNNNNAINKEDIFLTFETGHCISRKQLELVYDVSLCLIIIPKRSILNNLIFLLIF